METKKFALTIVAVFIAILVSCVLVGSVTAAGPTLGLTVVGTPPSRDFVAWANTLPRSSNGGRACWTGLLVFDESQVHPGFMSSFKPLPGWRCGVVVAQISLSARLSERVAREVLLLELGRLEVFDWVVRTGYLPVDDSDFITLADGLAYETALGASFKSGFELRHPLRVWDGVNRPTCDHLLAIQDLYSAGGTLGTGIYELLVREGCRIDLKIAQTTTNVARVAKINFLPGGANVSLVGYPGIQIDAAAEQVEQVLRRLYVHLVVGGVFTPQGAEFGNGLWIKYTRDADGSINLVRLYRYNEAGVERELWPKPW